MTCLHLLIRSLLLSDDKIGHKASFTSLYLFRVEADCTAFTAENANPAWRFLYNIVILLYILFYNALIPN